MLLPSAHAGAAVDLVPQDRWGNVLQDVLPRYERQARSPVPLSASCRSARGRRRRTDRPSLIQDHASFVLHMRRELSEPAGTNAPEASCTHAANAWLTSQYAFPDRQYGLPRGAERWLYGRYTRTGGGELCEQSQCSSASCRAQPDFYAHNLRKLVIQPTS